MVRYSHTYEGLVEFWIQTTSCSIKYRFDHYTTLASDVTTTGNISDKEVFSIPHYIISDLNIKNLSFEIIKKLHFMIGDLVYDDDHKLTP
jgi:hypothetical protein